MTTQYTGIDYSMGTANFDIDTGIHYGVISQHSVSLDVLSMELESDYGNATCPTCGNDMVDYDDNEHADYTETGGCFDYACELCERIYDSQESFPEEPLGFYIDDTDYKIVDCLDSDLMVLSSPYYTYAQYCSPCVPGAGNLDTPLHKDVGVQSYCLGVDWYDRDNPCPYVVYRVSDNAVVYLPW